MVFHLLPLIHSRRVVVSYKHEYVYQVLVNRLLSQAYPGKSVFRYTERLDMMGCKTTKQTNALRSKCNVTNQDYTGLAQA